MTTEVENKEAEAPKTWVNGKYKTPEDLENGYVSKDREYTKLATEHTSLKKQYEEVATVPESYHVPEGIAALPAVEIATMKQLAKSAKLSQLHFEGIVREAEAERQAANDKLENAKKTLGDASVNVLSDYVKKYYPEPLHHTIFTHLLTDETARSAAMSDRDRRLDNKIPGAGSGSNNMPEKYQGQRDLEDMGREYLKNPRNSKLREKMIDTARQIGEERRR